VYIYQLFIVGKRFATNANVQLQQTQTTAITVTWDKLTAWDWTNTKPIVQPYAFGTKYTTLSAKPVYP